MEITFSDTQYLNIISSFDNRVIFCGETYMPIIWRKAMSVGNDLIDHDHHFMVNFLNTIELILQTPEEKDMLIEAFEQLHEYSINHFRREESIQRKIGYPKSLQHKKSHKDLLKELEDLKNELRATKPSELPNRSSHIINFLRNWLVNHVLNEDLLLKPYLEKHPKAFT